MKKIHIRKNIYYLMAALAFIINLFAEAFVFGFAKSSYEQKGIIDVGNWIFQKHISQAAIIAFAAFLMVLFYNRYFKRHRRKKMKLFVVAAILAHLLRPAVFLFLGSSMFYTMFSLWVVLVDALFLTIFIAPTISDYFYIINVSIRILIFASLFYTISIIGLFLLGMKITFMEIAVATLLMMVSYVFLFTYYTILRIRGRR